MRTIILFTSKSAIQISFQTNPGSVSEAIQSLRSAENQDEVEISKRKIITLSHKSKLLRHEVIKELMKIIDTPEAHSKQVIDLDYYRVLCASTELLGDLEAKEAIPLLIDIISCNDGMVSLSTSQLPAARALVAIGEDSIEGLKKVVLEEASPRKYPALLALSEIGGDKAKEVLVETLRNEKDEQLRMVIKQMLQNWVKN